MSNKKSYIYGCLIVLVFSIWMFSNSDNKTEEFSEIVKVSLREVGNQLLHSNQDSTSLVLPIIVLEKSKYQLSFQQQLFMEPDSLVNLVKKSLKKSSLPNRYLVEVIQCVDKEVAYSYEVKGAEENSIIPCGGRFLPKSCYTINVRFTNKASFFNIQIFLSALIFIILILLQFIFFKKKKVVVTNESDEEHNVIGSFKFYPEQNKLVKEAIEINLSKKECELLAIFVANPNKIIKRDELTKRVWEDHGVFVGRSLDTYISKLRKKLKTDDSIKLTNVHGVGYKLEVRK